MTKSKKRTFVVEIPITGSISVEVDAVSEDAAIERAWELYGNGWEESGFDVTWEAVSCVTEGKVSHAMLNEERAQEVARGNSK